MPNIYRAYVIDERGSISRPATIIEANTDVNAISATEQLMNGHDIELWDGPRFVRSFKDSDK
jgi:hypothetical protein